MIACHTLPPQVCCCLPLHQLSQVGLAYQQRPRLVHAKPLTRQGLDAALHPADSDLLLAMLTMLACDLADSSMVPMRLMTLDTGMAGAAAVWGCAQQIPTLVQM